MHTNLSGLGCDSQESVQAPAAKVSCYIACPLTPRAGSGSDAASLLTSAKRKGDTYILNGSKVPLCSS